MKITIITNGERFGISKWNSWTEKEYWSTSGRWSLSIEHMKMFLKKIDAVKEVRLRFGTEVEIVEQKWRPV